MARATIDAQTARRSQVAELELRGASVAGIAKALKADPRTIARDLEALAQERAANVSLDGERHRLLAAAREVEREAWALYEDLPAKDVNGRLGALSKTLAAQAQGRDLVADLANVEMERRVAALESALAGRSTS